jgi:ribonuclease P protein 1
MESHHYNDEGADEFVDVSDDADESIDYEAITGNDPQKMEALREVLRDIQILRQKGYPCLPNHIPVKKWKRLLKCATYDERKDFLKYLFVIEKKEINVRKKKIERQRAFDEKPKLPRGEMTTASPVQYELGRNTLFHRTYQTRINMYYNYRLAIAEWFGPHLIIDCGYESYMTAKERHHCSKQLVLSWSRNRRYSVPFDIIFCNIEEDSAVYETFQRLIPTTDAMKNMVNFTDKHYMDLFPTEKLIYLSPHSDHVLEQYDSDAVYIIGA